MNRRCRGHSNGNGLGAPRPCERVGSVETRSRHKQPQSAAPCPRPMGSARVRQRVGVCDALVLPQRNSFGRFQPLRRHQPVREGARCRKQINGNTMPLLRHSTTLRRERQFGRWPRAAGQLEVNVRASDALCNRWHHPGPAPRPAQDCRVSGVQARGVAACLNPLPAGCPFLPERQEEMGRRIADERRPATCVYMELHPSACASPRISSSPCACTPRRVAGGPKPGAWHGL